MPNTKAVDKAFQLFQDKKYDKAAAALDKLIGKDELPAHIKARVKQFHQMALAATEKDEPGEKAGLNQFTLHINQTTRPQYPIM